MRLHITVMQKKFISFPVQSAIKIHSCSHLPLTCPCALVTSWPVTPWRLERALPKACELAMEPIAAAAAAAWLASGLLTSCKERKDQGENHWEAQAQHTDTTFTQERLFSPPRAHARALDSLEGHGGPSIWGWKEMVLHEHRASLSILGWVLA